MMRRTAFARACAAFARACTRAAACRGSCLVTAALLMCALLMSACTRDVPATDQPGDTTQADTAPAGLPQVPGATAAARLQTYAERALVLESVTRAGMRERLGPPDSAHSVPTPNRHIPGQTDSIVTVYYPGLAVELYRTDRGAEFVQRADVSTDRWLNFAPGIGSIAGAVAAALGEPSERTDSTLVFRCIPCSPVDEPITFFLADDRVHRVRFAYYVD